MLQTVAVLEERLTLTEDKLRECLDNQAVILEQMQQQPHKETRGAEGPAVWHVAHHQLSGVIKAVLKYKRLPPPASHLGTVFTLEGKKNRNKKERKESKEAQDGIWRAVRG